MATRSDILRYAEENYKTISEHLWGKYPSYEVLRHKHNKKWYAIIMSVPKNKIGLDGDELIDILNIKCEPELVVPLSSKEGFSRAYHMNKEHWLTVILNGAASNEEIYNLIDISHELTK